MTLPSPAPPEPSAPTSLPASPTTASPSGYSTDPLPHPPAGAESVPVDLRDLPAVEQAAAGTAAIHLAGVTQEGPFSEMGDYNFTATHHVLEATRRQHVPRVVLTSSPYVIGLTRIGDPAPELAPDSFYLVSTITAEALGHIYAHKTALTVVAVRIGSYRHPTQRTPPPDSAPRHHHPASQNPQGSWPGLPDPLLRPSDK